MPLWLSCLLSVSAAVVLSLYHPRWWVPVDVRAFTADGARDSLLTTFHRQRWRWRIGVGAGISLLAAAPLLLRGHLLAALFLGLGVGCWQAGYWLWYFNPALNLARCLDYVGEYHVSWKVGGASLDAYVWRHAWLQVRAAGETAPPEFPRADVVATAARLYRDYLRQCLHSGVLLALAGVVLAVEVLGPAGWLLPTF